MTATLIATMRNEGPYLLEWLTYHRLIGFTDIIVCSNDCVDGSPELLDLLAERGIMRHVRCAPAADDKAQLFAYRQVETLLDGDWPALIMVLDADEFLNIHAGGGSLDDLCAAVPDATAIHVNWRIFGSAGHARWSGEPVLRRFTRAAPQQHGVNWSYKTLFTNAEAYHCPLLPHGPGHARPEHLPGLRPVDGGGRPLPDHYARAETFLQTAPGGVCWRLAQVNHYNTRTWEDYLVKHARGGGLGPARWDRPANWQIFDRNEIHDTSIQRFLPAVDQGLAALRADPDVARAEARCCRLYGDHVAALRRIAA